MPNNNAINIEDSDYLYRRIVPIHQKNGKIRKGAFSPRKGSNNISIDIEKLTTPEECLSRSTVDGCLIAKIRAGYVRELGLEIHHCQEQENLAHGIIEGTFTSLISKKLAGNAKYI